MLQNKKILVLCFVLNSNLQADEQNEALKIWKERTYAYHECMFEAEMEYIKQQVISCSKDNKQGCETEKIVEITMEANENSTSFDDCEKIKPPNDLNKIKIE